MKKTPFLIILLFGLLVFGGKALTKTSSNFFEVEQSLVQFADTDTIVYPVMESSKTGNLCCGNTQYSSCIYPLCPPPS